MVQRETIRQDVEQALRDCDFVIQKGMGKQYDPVEGEHVSVRITFQPDELDGTRGSLYVHLVPHEHLFGDFSTEAVNGVRQLCEELEHSANSQIRSRAASELEVLQNVALSDLTLAGICLTLYIDNPDTQEGHACSLMLNETANEQGVIVFPGVEEQDRCELRVFDAESQPSQIRPLRAAKPERDETFQTFQMSATTQPAPDFQRAYIPATSAVPIQAALVGDPEESWLLLETQNKEWGGSTVQYRVGDQNGLIQFHSEDAVARWEASRRLEGSFGRLQRCKLQLQQNTTSPPAGSFYVVLNMESPEQVWSEEGMQRKLLVLPVGTLRGDFFSEATARQWWRKVREIRQPSEPEPSLVVLYDAASVTEAFAREAQYDDLLVYPIVEGRPQAGALTEPLEQALKQRHTSLTSDERTRPETDPTLLQYMLYPADFEPTTNLDAEDGQRSEQPNQNEAIDDPDQDEGDA